MARAGFTAIGSGKIRFGRDGLRVVAAHAEEHAEAPRDDPDNLVTDAHPRLRHPLDDRTHGRVKAREKR